MIDDKNEQYKGIIVTILVTESTASLLKLNLPHLEDITINSNSSICIISNETTCNQCPVSSANTGKYLNNEDILTEIAYFNKNLEFPDFDDLLNEDGELSIIMKNENYDNLKNVEELTNTAIEILDDDNSNTCSGIHNDYEYLDENKYISTPTNSYSRMNYLLYDQDELSTSDDEEIPYIVAKDEESAVLSTLLVLMRPIIMVNSTAHDERIKNEKNNLYISIINSELLITKSGWMNICRICHGGESTGSLLAPCRCRGSIALAHMACLERWLKESANSYCELCNHHYQIIRVPRYSVPWSVMLFLRHPGDHLRELVIDVIAFLIYTPSAITSTYMLMLLCEAVSRSAIHRQSNVPSHIMAFSAVFGIAAIDFTYSSWLMAILQRHVAAWRDWYRSNCDVRLILPKKKRIHYKKKYKPSEIEIIDVD